MSFRISLQWDFTVPSNRTDGKAIQGIENWIGGQIGKLEIFKTKKERLSFKRVM